jgi:hypothetical protein
MNVETALRRSTRNSQAIMAANVFTSVGCGTGASVISAAMLAATGASAAPMPAVWIVAVMAYSRYSRPVRVRNTVSRLGLSWVASRTCRPAAVPMAIRWTSPRRWIYLFSSHIGYSELLLSLVLDGLIAGREDRLSLPGPVRPHHQEYFRYDKEHE